MKFLFDAKRVQKLDHEVYCVNMNKYVTIWSQYMKKRNVLVCLTALAVSTFLGGCGGPEGPVPSKGDVAKYVKENISEKCEYVSRETVSESPKEIAYTYKSKERDLEFKVYAYRHNVGMYEMKIYKGKISET